jgi:hypothetical protein
MESSYNPNDPHRILVRALTATNMLSQGFVHLVEIRQHGSSGVADVGASLRGLDVQLAALTKLVRDLREKW